MANIAEPGCSRQNVFLNLIMCAGVIVAFNLTFYYTQSVSILRERKPRGNQIIRFKNAALFEGPICNEVHRVVFLKTHKTGSTTAASILQRFGMKRNLTFLVPDYRHILSEKDTFNTSMIGKPTSQKWNFSIGYQMLTNHIRYNRTEMDKVFHNATYVTVVRNPVAQFESGFYYFEMDRFLPKSGNPIELFMSNPIKYYNYVQQKYPGKENRMHNMQLYDLGMNPVDMYRMDVIDQKIKQLDKDFSLIMINEYFDESLVLLRKLLCWKMTDITYMSRGIRSASFRRNMTDDLRSKILQWNSGDAKLYDYFNRTFWEKVQNYEGDFEADLKIFKQHQEFVEKCIIRSNHSGSTDKRTIPATLVENAPKWCSDYRVSDIDSSERSCNRMRSLGIPQYKTGFYKSSRKVITKKITKRKHPDTNKNEVKLNNKNTDSKKLPKQKSSVNSSPNVSPIVINANQTIEDGKSHVVPKKKVIVVKQVRRPKKTGK